MNFHPDSMTNLEIVNGLSYDYGQPANDWYQKYDENDQVIQRSFFLDGKKLRTEIYGPAGLETVYQWDEEGELILHENYQKK